MRSPAAFVMGHGEFERNRRLTMIASRRYASILLLLGCALVSVGCEDDAPTRATCALTLELVDSDTGELLPGVVQIRDMQGKLVEIPELINRGQGIDPPGPIHEWWVLPRSTKITVPATTVAVHAFSGLETEIASREIDLTGTSKAELRLPLARFHRAREKGYIAGNTHLHLKALSREQADRYLREAPLVDGLDVVFVSYLERAEADLEYTSNKYSHRDLEQLSHNHVDSGHVHFGHGQEHRHNFGSHGEGYGHILLLDIPYIIQPVSIGPGIMKRGSDAPALQSGIDEARSLGGKVVWAHNLYGFEDIPNWITGRVHANNIYDGSHRGSFEDTYYRYLNIGLKVPFSTGTDWFIYDFSRVYVMSDRAITPREWLDRLAEGRTYITNGPLLEFTVDGQAIGATLDLDEPRDVTVRASAIGRADFHRLELIHNGTVVATATSRVSDGHFAAQMEQRVAIDGPAWLAIRTPPPPAPERDGAAANRFPANEYGGKLFSHTSPIYVRFAGRDVFDSETARGLLAEMESDWRQIEKQAVFANPGEREQVKRVYDEAIAKLQARLKEHAK